MGSLGVWRLCKTKADARESNRECVEDGSRQPVGDGCSLWIQMLHQNHFPGHTGSEEKQRWSFGATMITGVKDLRLGELGKDVGRLLGQSEQQLGNDHHGTVMTGRCCRSPGVQPGLACSLPLPEVCPFTVGHLLVK